MNYKFLLKLFANPDCSSYICAYIKCDIKCYFFNKAAYCRLENSSEKKVIPRQTLPGMAGRSLWPSFMLSGLQIR